MFVIKDRIWETSVSTGTGNMNLSGPKDNYLPFSHIGDGNTTYYSIVDTVNEEWEVLTDSKLE